MLTGKYKDKVAIVVVGYNRLEGISRLLWSVETAVFLDSDVPLVVSIDASGNEELYEYVRHFQWTHGDKIVNIQDSRLGLKNHIFKCGDLTKYFAAIVLLEDDLYVSPDFYNYVLSTLNKYGDNSKVAGISLYSEETNGYANLPFQPLQNGSDVFAWQTVSSWGQVWNFRMWNSFKLWLDSWDGDFEKIEMIKQIKTWTKAWSKYYYAYIVTNDLYFIYPYVSLSTNFNDAGGVHGGCDNAIVQVSLLQGSKIYSLFDFNELVKYNIYQENKLLYDILQISENELILDLYGQTYLDWQNKRFLLSTKKYDFRILKEYSLSLRPIELNVIKNIEGHGIFLYDTENVQKNQYAYHSVQYRIADYYLRGFNIRYLIIYTMRTCFLKITKRLHQYFVFRQ